MFSLEKQLRGDRRAAFQYLKGCHMKRDLSGFPVAPQGETRATEVASRQTGLSEVRLVLSSTSSCLQRE